MTAKQGPHRRPRTHRLEASLASQSHQVRAPERLRPEAPRPPLRQALRRHPYRPHLPHRPLRSPGTRTKQPDPLPLRVSKVESRRVRRSGRSTSRFATTLPARDRGAVSL